MELDTDLQKRPINREVAVLVLVILILLLISV